MIATELEEKKKRLRFTIKGDVKSSNIDEFSTEFTGLMANFKNSNWRDLYLDLRNARVIDSVALNWVFHLCNQLTSENRKLILQVASPAIHRVVVFSGLDKLAQVKYRARKQLR
jgi:anti-anti-sigma factor